MSVGQECCPGGAHRRSGAESPALAGAGAGAEAAAHPALVRASQRSSPAITTPAPFPLPSQTPGKGRGVIARSAIAAGSLVMEYVGEVISNASMTNRLNTQGVRARPRGRPERERGGLVLPGAAVTTRAPRSRCRHASPAPAREATSPSPFPSPPGLRAALAPLPLPPAATTLPSLPPSLRRRAVTST